MNTMKNTLLFKHTKLGLLLAFVLFSSLGWGQVTGDFRSTATGNWSTSTTWQRYNGTTWDVSGTGSNNPGLIPTSSNSVYIQTAHVVTLTENSSCQDLHICSGTSATLSATLLGRIALSTFTLSVSGKMRSFYASLNTIPGTSATGGFSIYPFTTTGGKVSIIGNTRTVFNTGEWGATISTPSANFPLDFSLNANQTATIAINIKVSSLTISSGTLDLGGTSTGIDNNVANTGDVLISSGAFVLSSGTANIFQKSGNAAAGTFTVNGTLILTGATPKFQMNAYDFSNGTIKYNLSGIQTLASRGTGTTPGNYPLSYGNLVLSGSSAKTTLASQTTSINGVLSIQGTASLALGVSATLTYGNASTLEYGGSAQQTVTTTEFPATGVNNLSITNTSGVIISASKTITGTLNVANGASLQLNSLSNLTLPKGITVANTGSDTGSFTVQNNANLIQTNTTAVTNTGNIIVNRNSASINLYDYTLWSSPVAGQKLKAFSPETLDTRFYSYNSTANLYNAVPAPLTTDFAIANGYLIRAPNTWTAATPTTFNGVFTGVPNNGTITISGLTSGNYYAVGNPYPSTISVADFYTANPTAGTLYFWRRTNGDVSTTAYATRNSLGATSASGGLTPSADIAVGQGFIVIPGATTLNFTNAMRATPSTSSTFLRTTKREIVFG